MERTPLRGGLPVRDRSSPLNIPLSNTNPIIHSLVKFPPVPSDTYPVGEGTVIAVPVVGQDSHRTRRMGAGRIVNKEEHMEGRWRIVWMTAALMIVLGSVTIFPRTGEAADHLRVVSGIVAGVSGNSFSIEGKSYDLKGIPAFHPSGRRLEVSGIVRGMKVDLYLQNNRINSVVVYDPMIE